MVTLARHFPWPLQLLAVSVDNHPISRSRRKPHAESRDGTTGLSQPNTPPPKPPSPGGFFI